MIIRHFRDDKKLNRPEKKFSMSQIHLHVRCSINESQLDVLMQITWW